MSIGLHEAKNLGDDHKLFRRLFPFRNYLLIISLPEGLSRPQIIPLRLIVSLQTVVTTNLCILDYSTQCNSKTFISKVVRYEKYGHYHAHMDSTIKDPSVPCCHQNYLRADDCRVCRLV